MKGKILISRELCKGCKYCLMSCPKGVISTERTFNKMGYFPAVPHAADKCTGCGFCAQMCPEIAIEVWADENSGNKNRKTGQAEKT